MSVLELFSGHEIFTKEARRRGHAAMTVDFEASFNPDLCADILTIDPRDLPIAKWIWASPPCETFSVASMGHHWHYNINGNHHVPKTPEAEIGLRILDKTIEIIASQPGCVWFIENPRGKMRKVINDLFRKHGITQYIRRTVHYCAYGEDYQKPTDIWTNCIEWTPRPRCKPGAPCHEEAPRGSKKGVQGVDGADQRAKLPQELVEEIWDTLEGDFNSFQTTLQKRTQA